MRSSERGDARDHAAGAPQLQIRPPDIVPAAAHRNAAFGDGRFLEAICPRFIAKCRLKARWNDKEDLEIAVSDDHAACISGSHAGIDTFFSVLKRLGRRIALTLAG